jgi:hypothetical protein
MLPGFVNGHHHIGLTPVQLGSPDMPLELWFVTRMVMRNVNLYLDTLYSAFEMIASGVFPRSPPFRPAPLARRGWLSRFNYVILLRARLIKRSGFGNLAKLGS